MLCLDLGVRNHPEDYAMVNAVFLTSLLGIILTSQ
jgi:hypothetical protein